MSITERSGATWNSGAATDTGLLRGSNEDRYWADPERGVFLVVDGVGGHAAGETAAQMAVDSIREFIFGDDPAETRIRRAITLANNRIFESARGDLAGMACVLTLALLEDGDLTIGHVGDSRLYLIWKGAMRKMTSDHSPVGESEDAGEISEDDAMRHPRRNEVFRDVGSRAHGPEDDEFIEIRKCRFRPDSAILLCSDGLTDQVPSTEVREIVDSYSGDPARVAADLVEAANAAGGSDNITAVFVAGPQFRGRSGPTRPRLSTTRIRRDRRWLTGRLAFLAYGVLIGMLVWAVLRAARG